MTQQYEHAGGAVRTTITGGIAATATAFTLDDESSWPDGSSGNPFWAIFDPEGSSEEHVLCSSRSGAVVNVAGSGRGADGTSAVAWSAGTVVVHGFPAVEADDFSDHIYDTTRDDHTQYLHGTNDVGVTGDLHSVGTVAAIGTTGKWMDAGSTLVLGTSSVTTAAIQATAVTTAKIALANITTALIADSNVTTAKIADSNVTTAKIADSNVTTAKINDLGVTSAKINDAAVTSGKIGSSAVTTAKIADANVTQAKLDSTIVGAWSPYTPTLTASTTSPTSGTGHTEVGHYLQIGKTVYCRGRIYVGTTGFNKGSGTYRISLPVAAKALATANDGYLYGTGTYFKSSGSLPYMTLALMDFGTSDNTYFCMLNLDQTFLNSTGTLASGDEIWWNIVYEAA